MGDLRPVDDTRQRPRDHYAREGTAPKSRMLVRLHPDVARPIWRFGREHHWVDYRPFRRNRLRLRDDVVIPDEPDEYGLRLVERPGH